ncbi:MAG: hypothetical protein FVQ79_04030 [Planctomycetes bacterium]|nr:hypothetical protein [Planctomycetota bacterium]
MKPAKITSIAIIVIIAIILTGCQDEQLSQCRLENDELITTVKDKQMELHKLNKGLMDSSRMLSVFITENEKLTNEIKALKKAAQQGQQAKPKPQIKKPVQTPEQKENIRKGIENLRKLQQDNAKRLLKEAAEKSTK